MDSNVTAVTDGELDMRAEIAARSKLRMLKDKEYKLLRVISIAHAFTTYTCLATVLSMMPYGADAVAPIVIFALLGLLSGYMFVAIWRKKLPPIWLVMLPSSIFVAIGIFLGAFTSGVFWVNVAAHVAVPSLLRVKKSLSAKSS